MDNIRELVKTAALALEDKKGSKIQVLNIAGLSPLADYFMLATGTNISQVHAMCDEVQAKLGATGHYPKSLEGYDKGTWILMDYGDFIIHIFQPEAREFYNLERIWKDAKTEDYKEM